MRMSPLSVLTDRAAARTSCAAMLPLSDASRTEGEAICAGERREMFPLSVSMSSVQAVSAGRVTVTSGVDKLKLKISEGPSSLSMMLRTPFV